MSRIQFETDLDKSIEAVAEAKAKCRFRLYKKTCSQSECAQCSVQERNNTLYCSFAPIDQVRIDNASDADFNMMCYRSPEVKLSLVQALGNLFKYTGIILGIVFLISTLLSITVFRASFRPKQTVYSNKTTEKLLQEAFENNIFYTSSLTAQHVYDVNLDSKVDCIDYTIIFYKFWISEYNRFNTDIEVVRNYNVGKRWHHLFVRVQDPLTHEWIYVEPQCALFENKTYSVQDIWGDTYDAVHNVYGETEEWICSGLS